MHRTIPSTSNHVYGRREFDAPLASSTMHPPADPGTRIASFDVFETLLVRRAGSPDAIFLMLGNRLRHRGLIDCTPEVFARARKSSARRAERNIGQRCTLQDIYRELASSLSLSEATTNQLMRVEHSLEADLLQPVPEGAQRVKAARQRGDRIVFLSDMYLTSAFIQEQLLRHGIWQDGDRVYVSHEYGSSKRSGGLYDELLRQEAVPSSHVHHYGNHFPSDVETARELGLSSDHFDDGNLNRHEQVLDRHAWATEGLSSALAGASRQARLAVSVSTPKERSLRDLAAGVVAPIIIGLRAVDPSKRPATWPAPRLFHLA